MNAFFVTLVAILVLGLAILQLILFKWTDGWLWPVLHIALFMVSASPAFRLVNHSTIGIHHRCLVHTDQVCAVSCLPLPFKTHHRQSSQGLEPALDLGDDASVQGRDQTDQVTHAIPGWLY